MLSQVPADRWKSVYPELDQAKRQQLIREELLVMEDRRKQQVRALQVQKNIVAEEARVEEGFERNLMQIAGEMADPTLISLYENEFRPAFSVPPLYPRQFQLMMAAVIIMVLDRLTKIRDGEPIEMSVEKDDIASLLTRPNPYALTPLKKNFLEVGEESKMPEQSPPKI